MPQPIDVLLDGVEWEPQPPPENIEPGACYATHKGVLRIMDHDFHVFVLNTGQRVFDASDLEVWFGITPGQQ